MKILLAPSERKTLGGGNPPVSKNSFIFSEIYEKRIESVKKYNEFLQTTDDVKNFGNDKTSVFERPTKKAVLRYSGVAFEYLKYSELDENSQKWIDENVLIFSNLFGVIGAGDLIPHYTLKQGSKPGFDIYSYHHNLFAPVLEKINENEPFIDLRAKFYEKIYKPKNAITFKFKKNNKVVSHFAKAYRGKLTAIIAKHRPQTIEEVLKIPFEGVKVIEIQEKKGVKEIICEVD